MSLKDLVAPQPKEEVSTPSETETVTVNENEEQASVTSVNTDENKDIETNEQNEEHPRFQKRINQLTGKNRELEDKLLQAEAAKEAIESNLENLQGGPQKEKTLADLNPEGLRDFLVRARDNEDLEKYVPEAQELLTQKLIDEGISRFKDEQKTVTSAETGQQLTDVMLGNLAEDRLNDNSTEYFATVEANLHDLGSPQFQNVNKDQLLAVALAEVNRLKSVQKGPSITEKVVQNRGNDKRIMANNRAATTGSNDLTSFLNEHKDEGLTRSTIGSNGSIKGAISRLNLMKEFEGG